MNKNIVVSGNLGPFKQGEVLTRDPAKAAYFTLQLNEIKDDGKETSLSSAEIIRVINETNTDGMSPEDVDITIVEALENLEAGGPDDDMPAVTETAAIARQANAANMASKLNGQFNAHLVAVLDAGDIVKKGPMWAADDTQNKWTQAEIEAMPFPGSKPPKGADLTKSNVIYDIYKVTAANGETIRGSYFGDIIANTAEGERISKRLQELVDENAKAKDLDLQDAIKLERKRLTDATTLLRRGVLINLALWAFKGLPLIEVEVQRDENNEPARTLYPVTVHQKGMSGGRKSLTLGQLLGLLKPDKDGQDGFARCRAKGGTIKAFIDYALPKKQNGKQAKGIVIANPDAAYSALFALQTYLDNGGDGAVTRMVNGPKSEAWVLMLGDIMSRLEPIWLSGDIADRYKAYHVKTRKTAA